MQHVPAIWLDPETHLARTLPDHPILYFSPQILHETAARFQDGFGGLVSYAVKANPGPAILSNLVAAGVTVFDVASPAEMSAARVASRDAVLHYNNPVRSEREVAEGIAADVASWSVDDFGELAKLDAVPRSAEIAVRFALPVEGAAYHFGDKFGAEPDQAVDLLKQVAGEGWTPSLSFHPGTQCEDAGAWVQYIAEAARIVERAGIRIARLNVGGGFASRRGEDNPDLEAVFAAINKATRKSFGKQAPQLLCEPGRSMVAEACTLATRIKGMREDGSALFLNDGIYGGLVDLRDMGLTGRVRVVSPAGRERRGKLRPRIVFGPTCDSLDRLPDGLMVPDSARSGDYVLFPGLGAYSSAMSTAFNGYGLRDIASVMNLGGVSAA